MIHFSYTLRTIYIKVHISRIKVNQPQYIKDKLDHFLGKSQMEHNHKRHHLNVLSQIFGLIFKYLKDIEAYTFKQDSIHHCTSQKRKKGGENIYLRKYFLKRIRELCVIRISKIIVIPIIIVYIFCVARLFLHLLNKYHH